MCCLIDETVTVSIQKCLEEVRAKRMWGGQGESKCSGNARWQTQDAFDRSTVLTLLRLRGWDGERGPGGWRLSPQRGGTPGKFTSLSVTHFVSLEFLYLNIYSFLIVRFILPWKEALKRLYFLLIGRREELVIVSPISQNCSPDYLRGPQRSLCCSRGAGVFSSPIP